jgi:long-chain acyl-CoA synthetase
MAERRTIAHLVYQRAQQSRDQVSFYTEEGGGYQPVNWGESYARSTELAMGLVALGVGKGDRIAIISETRYEWTQFDSAILSFGGVVVGIYPTSTAEQVGYILGHSGSRIAILENEAQLDKLRSLDLPDLEHVVLIDSQNAPAGEWLSIGQLAERGRSLLEERPELPGTHRDAVQPEDMAAIVYTSGTTGPPKGVVLRHENLYDVAESVNEFIDLTMDDVALAFLPMAHVLQRVNSYIASSTGLTGYYVRDITKLVEVCQVANPTVISGVPRIFERIHARVMAGVEQAPPRRQRLVKSALEAGRQRLRLMEAGRPIPWSLKLKLALYDRLVFSKLRSALFGQRIRYFTSGAAPLGMEQLEFFFAIGLPLFEGYGLTETSSPITLNGFSKFKVGTVGPPLPGAEVKIGEDGEILLKGPGVFREYYKDAEATREAFTEDGWFRSGDIGELDEEGFLRVTDRSKNLIITSGGKNIAPANIENLMMSNPYLSQVMVHGDRRKYLVALITLDEEAIRTWADERGKGDLSYEALAQDDEVQQMVAAAVDRCNQALAPFEQIRYFRLLPEELSVETDLITPTLKVKRHVVEEKYGDLLEEMYA